GAVFGDEQRALQCSAEGLVLIFDDAVGRDVRAKVPCRAAVVGIGLCADGILRENLVGHRAGRWISAVQDIFAARGIGVAVVAPLLDVVEIVSLGRRHVGDAGDIGAVVGLPGIDAPAINLCGIGGAERRRVAAGTGTIVDGEQVSVSRENQAE